MSLTSPWYYAFLAIVLAIYFSIPLRWRGYLLLLSSYAFYMSLNPKYIIFIIAITCISFFGARMIVLVQGHSTKKMILFSSLSIILGMLGYTKYWNAIAELSKSLPVLEILIPLGISFYTFQSIGYLLDVYRNEIKAEKSFSKFALFISFFPHLLAGPIEKSQDFLPQINQQSRVNIKEISFGCMMIVIGLFKKLVIADRLKPIVAFVFDTPSDHLGPSVALAAFIARYQIYCDFSGYTDIAIGSALMFGYKLSPNFNRPFFSKSISEYWQNWHITLTSWIKKYVFYPLITSRLIFIGFSGIIIINFLALGLWHGASVNFLLYGLIQALFMLIDTKTAHIRHSFYNLSGLSQFPLLLNSLAVSFTFFILVVPPTLLFSAPDFATSKILYSNLFKTWRIDYLTSIFSSYYFRNCFTIALSAIIFMEIADWMQKKKINFGNYIWTKSRTVFFILLIAALLVTITFGNYNHSAKFIYTKF